jgi:signal transduction histidine kinase
MVVERHKGTIDFTSAAGQGTTFRINLPAVVA